MADCIPVFLYDPLLRVIGVAHAGWRGTLRGVIRKTVEVMQATWGTRPESLHAAIGPSIEAACYPVGQEVAEKFEDRFVRVEKEQKLSRVDLWAANEAQLQEAGLSRENIVNPRLCTSCRSDLFYSHRASGGLTGRMLGVIGLL